ncbi:DUF3822 family protein [Mucilaginibacter litoreus]|uniref:DUF3822 family protein n=1 Tax=Mucilaginibacter litoreus TaxID=1048221 RepID=A0ABW3AS30_9SPHI
MIENTNLYTSHDFSFNQADSYTLLLQLNATAFSYAVINDKQLLAWGENFNTDELKNPEKLSNILTANFKLVIAGLKSDIFTLLPRSLYDNSRLTDAARLLDVQEHEKVGFQVIDDNNIIAYKADRVVTQIINDFHNPVLCNADAGWIKAIGLNYPSNNTLYLNISNETVSIVNYKFSKLRFYNTFSFKNHEELAYFCALVATELELKPQNVKLLISGKINSTDVSFNYLKDFFGEVTLNGVTVLDLPSDVKPHQILNLSALSLCVSSEEN